jgi:DNA mismatch repair protein MutS
MPPPMTPMMKQYGKIKEQYRDAILFFRLGDFYEMFFEDALEAAKLLQITLTSRNKGDHKAPMCGIPYHAANNYIAKLTRLGKKVAICEQLTDPNLPGIVERDVVRVITPGTTLDDNILDQKANNFIAAITPAGGGAAGQDGVIGFAYADVSTGEFLKTTIESTQKLKAELQRIGPAEIIIPRAQFETDIFRQLRAANTGICFFPCDSTESDAEKILTDYLKATQKTSLSHLQKVESYETGAFMPLDEATLKNLELLTTLRENKKEGSLLWVLDRSITAMGGRLLRQWLTHPLVNKNEIDLRLEAAGEAVKNQKLLEDLRDVLKSVLDLERLLARLSLGHGNARDLVGLKVSLQMIPRVTGLLAGVSSLLLAQVRGMIDPLEDLSALIGKAIVPEPPLAITDGGMIADGYNAELDGLKKISREGKSFIQNLQQQEIARTGIGNLKVRYNKIFGYYIELSKGNASRAPENYIRRQTLVNAERFITPELKEFEEKILGAEEKIVAIEQRLFTEVRAQVVLQTMRIQQTAKALATLDVICSYAKTALENNYCKPEVNESGLIRIEGGRHPVVEKMNFAGRFVPNDAVISQDGQRLLLITGPNMGGKSTYLRQTALIVLMAHIGSFVPANAAVISLTDRIFTRVGASDNLVRGQSTFMVEMQEAANILANATGKSLVILDEIGRGTSTYDGMSIAWAIMEHLHDRIRCKTLFATHYHELISLADKLPNAANFSVAVREDAADGVVFLYKISPGGVDRSYGIEVARLAGLPAEVVQKARRILVDLEEGVLESGIKKELEDSTKRVPENSWGFLNGGTGGSAVVIPVSKMQTIRRCRT